MNLRLSLLFSQFRNKIRIWDKNEKERKIIQDIKNHIQIQLKSKKKFLNIDNENKENKIGLDFA